MSLLIAETVVVLNDVVEQRPVELNDHVPMLIGRVMTATAAIPGYLSAYFVNPYQPMYRIGLTSAPVVL